MPLARKHDQTPFLVNCLGVLLVPYLALLIGSVRFLSYGGYIEKDRLSEKINAIDRDLTKRSHRYDAALPVFDKVFLDVKRLDADRTEESVRVQRVRVRFPFW